MKGRIGDILVEMGFIGRDQLETAAMESKKTQALLGDVLLRLDWVTQDQLQMAIAVQSGAQMLLAINQMLQLLTNMLGSGNPNAAANSVDAAVGRHKKIKNESRSNIEKGIH